MMDNNFDNSFDNSFDTPDDNVNTSMEVEKDIPSLHRRSADAGEEEEVDLLFTLLLSASMQNELHGSIMHPEEQLKEQQHLERRLSRQ